MSISKVQFNIYNIVEDGMVANPYLGEGRMIPALVLKSDKDSGLKDLLEVHRDSPPGDVTVTWGFPISTYFKPKTWYLQIEFKQPMDFLFQIKFELKKDYSLINAIFKSRCLYITTGVKGQKASSKIDDSVLVEVPNTNMDKQWAETLNVILRDKYKKEGINKKDLKKVIKNHLDNMEEFLSSRVKRK